MIFSKFRMHFSTISGQKSFLQSSLKTSSSALKTEELFAHFQTKKHSCVLSCLIWTVPSLYTLVISEVHYDNVKSLYISSDRIRKLIRTISGIRTFSGTEECNRKNSETFPPASQNNILGTFGFTGTENVDDNSPCRDKNGLWNQDYRA